METQMLQKEERLEVHLPLLFIYMIQGQWGQLEKGPECLVLINHGSRRAIIYVSTPMWSFKSSFGARRSEASVVASLCLYFFIGAAEQILGALSLIYSWARRTISAFLVFISSFVWREFEEGQEANTVSADEGLVSSERKREMVLVVLITK